MARRSFPVVLLLAALRVWAQPCEAPSNIKAAMDAAALSGKPLEERIAAARKIRDRFPADYFAHRFYQETFFNLPANQAVNQAVNQSVNQGLFPKPVQEEYQALLDAHPDDTLYLLLYARTLKGTNTPEAIKLLDQVLAHEPDNPQARQKLLEIYSAPAFRSAEKLRVNVESYRKACPTSLVGYYAAYLNPIDDPGFLRESAANLRSLLDARDDDEALRTYSALWSLEFKSVPLSAQEPVRERVRKDVARLRAADWSKSPYLLTELAQAYKMLGDTEGSKWVEAHQPPNNSTHSSAATEAINQWRQANPYKGGAQREAYQDQLLKQAGEWIRQWPEDPQPYFERFNAMRMNGDAPLEDMVKAAADWLRVYEQHPGSFAPYMQVAQFYSQHNMRYGELPGLLEKALQQTPLRAPAPVSDLFLANSQARIASSYGAWSNLNSAAMIYLKIRKYDRAGELLARLGPGMLNEKPPDSASDQDKRMYATQEFMYWNNMAKLSRAEGHQLEALTYERNSLWSDPNTSLSPEQFRTAALRQSWKEINGSENGFEAWIAKPGSSSPRPPDAPKSDAPKSAASVAPTQSAATVQTDWTKLDKPLPDFQISDAEGKTWRLADLKGKVALVNLWATWCAPCRMELPYLQKLFNKVRERKDILVLTLNMDDNPGLIEPFLKENKYTFPVLPASGYVSKLVPELSIPRNWIVSADGVLRMERIGFGAVGDNWVDETIGVMEKARP